MSKITFDGDRILNKPDINYDAYFKWRHEQQQDLNRIMAEEEASNADKALTLWQDMIPHTYQKATIDSIRSYEPRIAGRLDSMIDQVIEHPSHPIHLALSSEMMSYTGGDGKTHKRPIRGKTWAAFAYVHDLIDRTSYISDPSSQIVYKMESDIIDDIYNYKTRTTAMRTLVNNQRKLLIIDSCGQTNSNVRSDALNRLIDAVNANGHITMILIISSNQWALDDFKPLVARLQPPPRRMKLRAEPDTLDTEE